MSPEDLELGREERRAKPVGLIQPAARLRTAARGGRDDAGMEEEPGIAGVRRKGTLHRGACFIEPPRRGQSPGVGVFGKDVATHRQLAFRELDGVLLLDAACRQKERDRTRIGRRAASEQLLLDRGCLRLSALAPQRVGQRPLVLGEWIEARGLFERVNGLAGRFNVSRTRPRNSSAAA